MVLLRIREERQGFKQGEKTLHEGNADKRHQHQEGKGGKKSQKEA